MAMSVLGMISNAQGKMTSPREVMEVVNADLVNRVKGDYWYATAFYAKIHVENLTVTFARAGHELPILWTDAEGKCRFLEGNGLPLGMFHNAEYETCQTQMGEGDKLVLYTDGLCDATNDEGERFGSKRLVDLVTRYSSLSAKNLLKVIELNVTKFMGSQPQTDDIALIIISVVPDSWNRLSIPPYTFNEVLDNIVRELTLKNVSDDVIFKVRLSLDECITNAIKHGHRSNYLEKILVSYLIDSEKIVIQIQDRGEGFDYASLPDPTVEYYLQLPEGRGVFLTMQVMDKVEFNDVGNVVTLSKYFDR
jgi:anti-sigma regulatory factor (Ser/Thr protein kinase)